LLPDREITAFGDAANVHKFVMKAVIMGATFLRLSGSRVRRKTEIAETLVSLKECIWHSPKFCLLLLRKILRKEEAFLNPYNLNIE